MVLHRGDIHHIFPKEYLKKGGLTRNKYNQIANYVYAQQEINIKIGKKSPKEYFNTLKEQVSGGARIYGSLHTLEELHENLKANCIPLEILDEDMDYNAFLEKRRKLMAKKIKDYYFTL